MVNIKSSANLNVDPFDVNGIQFDLTSPTTPSAEGLLTWNNVDGALQIGLSAGVEDLLTASTADDLYVNITGDTMTGNLEIQKTTPVFDLTDDVDSKFFRMSKLDSMSEAYMSTEIDEPQITSYAIESGSRTYIATGQSATLSGWFYTGSTPSTLSGSLWYNGNGSANGYGIYLYSGKIDALYGGRKSQVFSSTVDFPQNKWIFIALRVTYSFPSYSANLWYGTEDDTSLTQIGSTSSQIFNIPASGSLVTANPSILADELTIWNRVVSIPDLETVFNAGQGNYGDTGIAPWNSGLQAGYHCDEGSGTTTADYSGNSRTLSSVSGWDTGKSFAPIVKEIKIFSVKDGSVAFQEGEITFGTSDTDTITNITGTEINFLTNTKRADNIKDYWGIADDASIYYDGTDLIIDPAVVGSGILDVSTNIESPAFVTDGGTSNDFVKGDGSLDSSAYLTTVDISDDTNLAVTSPVVLTDDTISLNGLTGFGTAGQVIATNATTDGLEWIDAGAGGSVSFGTDNQVPFTNATTDDFDYSSNFVFDGNNLGIGKTPSYTLDVLYKTAAASPWDLSAFYLYLDDYEGHTETGGSYVTPDRIGQNTVVYSDLTLSSPTSLGIITTYGHKVISANYGTLSGTGYSSGAQLLTYGLNFLADNRGKFNVGYSGDMRSYGIYGGATDNSVINNAGANVDSKVYASYVDASLGTTLTSYSAHSQEGYGGFFRVQEQAANQATAPIAYVGYFTTYSGRTSTPLTSYGVYVGDLAGDAKGLVLANDNSAGGAYFGAGQDASIYYDGTDLCIDSSEAGSGTIDLKGQTATAITTETLSEYITVKINGVSKKLAIVA